MTAGVEMMTPNSKGKDSKDNNALTVGANGNKDQAKPSEFEIKLKRARMTAAWFGEHGYFSSLMSVITIYTLYQSDIRLAATGKEADEGFMIVASIIFFIFLFEIFLQSFYKDGYCYIPSWAAEPGESLTDTWWRRMQVGSFYFWLDWIATLTLIFDLNWILPDDALSGGGGGNAAGAAKSGARAGRVIRLVRMVRLLRMVKVYKYVFVAYAYITGKKVEVEDEDEIGGSRVGAAMTDLTNRRVIVLILLMLVIIPTLTVNDPDVSLAVSARMVHDLAVKAASDPTTYESGLQLAIDIIKRELPLIYLSFNGVVAYVDQSRYDELRSVEMSKFIFTSSTMDSTITFDQKYDSVQGALFSIYTTSFVIGLLLSGIYFFSTDVNKLVIGPIEKLVELVRKISANPLEVEYKAMGEKDGFVDGMETTILLTTITKIGALMRVGFGEAGAAVIARNLNDGEGGGNGKLNLMGSGVMINSIFGFCDVRQFTDTTECLQEEVMLFVNRIAHILHNIVVQCSGAANKNIGDAFLLTWKIDDTKMSAEKISTIADQALLTFTKALIELSRYQEFICNFSVAATARLLKRFPDYNVRIGSGLHVGWAIEGAIGSHRKIDASYLSPHVGNTEFLESSTKQYGVSLLMSEPFVNLLSPAAKKWVRKVDRIRKSELEEPFCLYTYDSDLTINWNDPYRKTKDPKARLKLAAKKAAKFSQQQKSQASAGGPRRPSNATQGSAAGAAVHTVGSIASVGEGSDTDTTNKPGRKTSRDIIGGENTLTGSGSSVALNVGNRRTSNFGHGGLPVVAGALPQIPSLQEVDETDPEAAELDAQKSADKSKESPTITVPPYTQQVWTEDQDLVDLRHMITDPIRTLWDKGIEAYIAGDWATAKEVFEETLRMTKGKDGPSKQLLGYIGEHGNVAPSNWKGYRMDEEGGH